MTSASLAPPPRTLLDDASLFLDFDGTLVALAATPDAVSVDEDLAGLLVRLARRLDGRVALVSGRSVAQLDGFFGDGARALAVVGSHGAETRHADGTVTSPPRPDALDEAERAFAAAFADRGGVVIEPKSFGVGVHYRQAPAVEEEAKAMVEAFAADHALHVQHGKMMVELRLPGHDKGSAITELMAAAPFAGHPPVFLGDDLTDEPGFTACADAGGAGVLVGEARDTDARYRLDDVAAVRAWLAAAAG